jgi:hypothetical protein
VKQSQLSKYLETKIPKVITTKSQVLLLMNGFFMEDSPYRHPYVSSRSFKEKKNLRNLAKKITNFLSKILNQYR